MDKKQAEEIAYKVVDDLFADHMHRGKPVVRLMQVFGGENYKNPGWSQDAIRAIIVNRLTEKQE